MIGEGLKVERAIFGDVGGAHNLVAASPGLPDFLLTDLAAHYTDRLLSSEHAWSSYRCGFPVKGYYVLTQTFPVKATRGGMVQTHAVIIPLANVKLIQKLQDLADLLPTEPIAPAAVASAAEPTTLLLGSQQPAPSAPLGYLPVVQRLLQDLTPVWVGQPGFWEVVAYIWRNLWPAARERFHFRMGSERGESDQSVTLLCTLVETRTHWDNRSFVDQSAPLGTELTPTEAFLAGAPESRAIAEARARLGFSQPKISDIKRLVDYVAQLKEGSADSVRSATRILGQLAPEVTQNAAEKILLIQQLADLSAKGSETDVLGLRNLNVTPFAGADAALADAMCAWMRERIRQGTGGLSVAKEVFLNNRDWDAFARAAVVKAFTPWLPANAEILWTWWTQEPALIQATSSLLPAEAEIAQESLIQSVPTTLPMDTHEPLLRLAQARRWYRLHGVVLARASGLPAMDRFRRQIQFDSNVAQVDGLLCLAQSVGSAEVVQAAAEIGDPRLVRLAAEAIFRCPALLAPMDPTDPHWQAIWASALRLGADLYQGLVDFPSTATRLLSRSLEGHTVPTFLLERVIADARTPLLDYPRRAKVWSLTDNAPLRQAALNRVAGLWLARFLVAEAFDATPLEPVLETAVLKSWQETRRQYPAASVVSMHRRFDSLGEWDVIGWLSETPYARSTSDAATLGDLIAEKQWARAADRLANVVLNVRGHLDAAIHQCSQLLDRWRRIRVSLLVPDVPTSKDEWWEEFAEQASLLFSAGINDTNIWLDSGGDPSLVSINLSGRDQWTYALHLLRQGGGGQFIKIDGLLHQMRNRFYNNSELETLEQAYLRRIRRSHS